MSGVAQKIPMQLGLNLLAQRRALEQIAILGKALPASVTAVQGGIVTVKFEVNGGGANLPPVTIPALMWEYIRVPIQVGDKGVVFPADVRLGAISGLGASAAPALTLPANLAALIWVPIGNTDWSTSEDTNAVVIYGPDGVIIRNTAKTASFAISTSVGAVAKFPLGKTMNLGQIPTAPTGHSGDLYRSGTQVNIVP